MIQMEVRRQKYTSEEAVKASRLAVQRRVAAKLERAAQKVKEAEAAEAEKKEKMQQVSFQGSVNDSCNLFRVARSVFLQIFARH